MAVLSMQKIRLFVSRNDAVALLELLQDFGNIELIDNTQDEMLTPGELADFEHRHLSAQLDSAVAFLSQYHKGSFWRGMFEGNRTHTNKTELEEKVANYDPCPAIEEVQKIQKEMSSNTQEEKRLEEQLQKLHAWTRLSIPLRSITNTQNTTVFPVVGPLKTLESLKENLQEHAEVAIEDVSDTALIVIAHNDVRDEIEETILGYNLEITSFPTEGSSAKEQIAQIKKAEERVEKQREALEQKAQKLAEDHLDSLKIVSDHALWKMEQVDVAGTRPGTEFTKAVVGWVPVRVLPQLKERLEKEMPHVALEELEPEEGEEPPVEIANKGVLNPFETITRLYGVPTHTDLDPTPFLALFFFLFFGMSLSDVAYGAILMLATGTVLLRYHIDRGMKQLLTMLFFGGFGSFIIGFLFGGYLGVDPSAIHPALSAIQLFDPINNPLPVFYMALAFGFVHISFGIMLSILRSAKNGQLVMGLIDNVPWLLMFVVLLAFVLASVNLLPNALNTLVLAWWGNTAIAVAVLIAITKGMQEKGVFSKVFKGVLSLYDGVGYFSDLLSYSRLLALGLATGALAFSVNLIAGFIGGETLGLGTLFAAIILVFGHALNITLSILGAFIHSARLQFVEFFSKFLTGTGRTFKAFRKKERNVIMLPETPT